MTKDEAIEKALSSWYDEASDNIQSRSSDQVADHAKLTAEIAEVRAALGIA